ncbi:hypothetical protein P175DRAFT_0560274 [Aspergillus ochraceoroseus IBT 24754]|uniref:C2H2-type domain-containing protein n=1 Tax=Aspergillus ochraceoroseus IBT 24754 TaxID=1392256 RepID=A0A2T5LQ29_9EURO|nr:uncharacterized protein P175DRAFT_0560274 [Aspergillus ochraceoroseus IBT 24754]PTU18379.1 hypothetical protein P175DRAFT_0560274 [Aspergillus ochraceoroseus IBT 24754]
MPRSRTLCARIHRAHLFLPEEALSLARFGCHPLSSSLRSLDPCKLTLDSITFHPSSPCIVASLLLKPPSHLDLRSARTLILSRQKFRSASQISTSETSSTSAVTDDDSPYASATDTELTDLERASSRYRKAKRGKTSINASVQAGPTNCPPPSAKDVCVLTVEQLHRARYEDPADDTDEDLANVPEDYGKSSNTKIQKLRLKNRWARYCRVNAIKPSADPKWEDAEEALQQATPNDMHRFLNFCLKLKYNSDGRRLKGYKKASAIQADWKYFRVYYTRVTKHEMSEEMGEAVRTGLKHLIDKHGLDKQPRENVPVYIEDMVPLNETILQTREKRFHLGFQRISLCLYNVIGLFTVNRKHAVLSLQFKHLQITLQRDPHGGPPVPMIELKPEILKNLGMAKLYGAHRFEYPSHAHIQFLLHSNTFALPEIVYGVSLVFSPHVLIFSILFYARAFEAPDLKSMDDLRRLLVEDDRQEMPLPLKPEMDNYYVFPRVDLVNGQPKILWETPLNGNKLHGQLRSLSEIHGFLNPFFSHQFRYGGGQLLDESGFVSEAQRNVIMLHASSKTFVQHYRPRRHAGLQEIMCGLNPDVEFSRAVTRMSRWIDKRRPRYLSELDRALVEKDPVLQAAVRWQADLEIQRNRSEDSAKKQRKQLRRDFSRKQAVIDIQRQLSGGAVNDEPAREILRQEFAMPPEQILLIETFFTWPTSDSLEDEWMRRNQAVAAAIQYCGFPEGGPLRGRPKRPAPAEDEECIARPPARKQKSEVRPSISAWEEQSAALDEQIKEDLKPQVCFQCRKKYSDHYGLRRHFKMSHLQDRKMQLL